TDTRLIPHARGESGPGAEFVKTTVLIKGFAPGMGSSLVGTGVIFALVRNAVPPARIRLKVDLDAMAIQIPEIGGLADEVIGGGNADIALQGAHGHLRQLKARRHMDGDVIEPQAARHGRPIGTRFEDDENFAARAEREAIAL